MLIDQIVPSIWSLSCSPTSDLPDHIERYSRKVFVGGLPPDIDEGMKTFYACAQAINYSLTRVRSLRDILRLRP